MIFEIGVMKRNFLWFLAFIPVFYILVRPCLHFILSNDFRSKITFYTYKYILMSYFIDAVSILFNRDYNNTYR